MKTQFNRICSGVMLLSSLALAPLAQAQQSLEQILQDVQAQRAASQAEFDQRAQQWAGAPEAQQQTMLNEITAERDRLLALTQAEAERFAQNDLQITELNNQLRERANGFGLGELFGLVRQFAADQSTAMEQSLIGAQFAGEDPTRVEFMNELAASDSIFTTEDLEKLWVEIQRELTAGGQVARFDATVVQANGVPQETTAVRIGPFIATSNGQFLTYLPALNQLNVLPRQPDEELLNTVRAFESATSGYVPAIVDQTRGVLISMVSERPTLEERIELGEEVGYVIIIVGVVGLIGFIFQFIYLIIARIGVSRQMKNMNKPMANNALGRVLLSFRSNERDIEEDAEIVELRISEAVLREIPRLERIQPLLRLAVAAGPLLGLVGTVVGMIITFQSITETGQSDPRLMATGIGQAMIATVLGLGIAVPLLFANAALSSLSRSIIQILDEQSTGMLAEQLERQRKA
ncbi:MAG TPA: MotA/TolQ/ExbB proton channel family protein [Pseudomonadales bacterium]